MKKIGWPGKGYKFACHRCGFWFPSTEIRKEWTGLSVCSPCWETRHEQTLIKIRGERAFPEVVSKDGTDTFVQACDVVTSSGYTGLGTTDCMKVGNDSVPYDALIGLLTNGHGDI